MLTFFKRLFQKPASQPKALPSRIAPEPMVAVAKVETALLSLAAIIARFPAELKKTVATMPEPEVMVALPLSTILKQLPGGSVKMSLASIYRQSPPGTFSAPRVEEKRMVEIPLGEIFKRVKPDLLKRRDDQRMHELAEEEGFDVFGDPENPFAVAPTALKEPESAPVLPPPPALKLAFESPRAVRSPQPMISAPPLGLAPEMKRRPQTEPIRVAPPTPPFAPPSTASAPLVLPLSTVSAGWPEEILAEISLLTDATVSLPAADVTTGLAKGKVAFSWGEIRSWITPAPTDATQAKEGIELPIPLRIVAPAFLKLSKDSSTRKRLAVDDSIPTLFAGVPMKPAPEPIPTVDEAVETVPEPAFKMAATPSAPPAEAKPENATAPAFTGPIGPVESRPSSVGDIFGRHEKEDWSPAEIVQNVVRLPQIAGAVVGLQEGLVVAHSLPETMKGEVVAAFLPQIFGRLNQYSGEMKLGEIDDVLMCTHGAYFQIFRLGYVFFAVLGKPGESLPWQELRLIADELSRQTQK